MITITGLTKEQESYFQDWFVKSGADIFAEYIDSKDEEEANLNFTLSTFGKPDVVYITRDDEFNSESDRFAIF